MSDSVRPHRQQPTRLPVPGILQARTPDWVAISSSRGSSQPRDQTQSSCIAGGFFTCWDIGEPLCDIIVIHGFPDSKQNHWSHEIKRHLLLGWKVMTSLDSILKSRDITLPTKVHLVKVMVFPVIMYGCESWTIKKAECQRIDAFELWCWRRLLRVLGLQGDPTSPS